MPRAIWKGHLKIAELACPVALHAAASTSERVAFRMVSRSTGHRVGRDYVDDKTGKPVGRDDQARGYTTEDDRLVVLAPEDLASAVPESDKTLRVEAFIACPDIDTTYLDKPYYLGPARRDAAGCFALIREAMRAKGVAALARAVLFRRVRSLLVRAQGPGLVADTLNFDYEVRPAARTFRAIPDREIEPEMLDLARHIIETKRGSFDPAGFEDRYDAALAALVRAKAEGRAFEPPERPAEPVVVDLLEALRRSAGARGGGKAAAGAGARSGSRRGKAAASGGRGAPASRRKAG